MFIVGNFGEIWHRLNIDSYCKEQRAEYLQLAIDEYVCKDDIFGDSGNAGVSFVIKGSVKFQFCFFYT